jgi:hypothetical protein
MWYVNQYHGALCTVFYELSTVAHFLYYLHIFHFQLHAFFAEKAFESLTWHVLPTCPVPFKQIPRASWKLKSTSSGHNNTLACFRILKLEYWLLYRWVTRINDSLHVAEAVSPK